MVKWSEEYGDRGLVVIEIDGGQYEPREPVRQAVMLSGVGHHVLWDASNSNHQAYGVVAWPSAYLIGADGKVIWEGNPARIMNRPDALERLETILENQLRVRTSTLSSTDSRK